MAIVLNVIFLGITSAQTAIADSGCLEWFLKSGLVPKKEDCELKCSITPVDMGTFSCTSQCQELCSKSTSELILAYVPRLTEGDKLAISKYPYEAVRVFLSKEKVDRLTEKIFDRPGKNDESDAFRHFVWSGLLAKEIGKEKAKVFLDAHEVDSTQTNLEKEMDHFNNAKGLEYYQDLQKQKKAAELDTLEKEALYRLRAGKLKVLEPKLKKIPGGYYSQ